MKIISNLPILSIVFCILGIVNFYSLIYSHELAHSEIYRSYGIDSHIKMGINKATTYGDKTCNNEACTLAHNINDSIGYHLIYLYGLIFLGLLYLIAINEKKFMLEWKKYKDLNKTY